MDQFKEKYKHVFKMLVDLYNKIDFNKIYNEINEFKVDIKDIDLHNFSKYIIDCEAYRDRLLFLETQNKNLLNWFDDIISPLIKAGNKYSQGSNKEIREGIVYDEFIDYIKMNIEIKNLYNTCYMRRLTFDKKIEVISRWLSAYQNSLKLNPLGQAVDCNEYLENKNSQYHSIDCDDSCINNEMFLVKNVDLKNVD